MSCQPIFTNPAAASWAFAGQDINSLNVARKFHHSLPNFSPTPLVPLEDLAREFGVHGVFVKAETSRLGLPAFKILGASWGAFRAIVGLDPSAKLSPESSIDEVSRFAKQRGVVLYTATDGNHGRAVARIAAVMGVRAEIFVPRFTPKSTRDLIESEGGTVTVVQGDYDAAVTESYEKSKTREGGLFVQDTSFEGYEEIPTWIIEGYTTMLQEIKQQLDDLKLKASIVVTPVGVGSLAHAVVSFCKSHDRQINVLAIEPERAACLNASLQAGAMTTIKTTTTIMDGMNCGSVSPMSWPILSKGVDASVTISDQQSREAVQYLHAHGIEAGPCGAGSLAALRRVAIESPDAIRLSPKSVIVLLCTEGRRDYPIPYPGLP